MDLPVCILRGKSDGDVGAAGGDVVSNGLLIDPTYPLGWTFATQSWDSFIRMMQQSVSIRPYKTRSGR